MARYGHKPLAAAVAALSLASITVHLPPSTGANALNHVLDQAGSGPPTGADRPQSQPHTLRAGGWALTKDGLAKPDPTRPDSPPKGSRTGQTDPTGHADQAGTGAASRSATTPDTAPTTGPAGPTATATPRKPKTVPASPRQPSGSAPGTSRTATVPGCPATGPAILRKAPGTGRTVALTFDDGPGPTTAAVLDVLAAQHVHATFFVIGKAVAAAPATVIRTTAEGHLIGNHTWDHDYPRAVPLGWTTSYLRDQLSRTNAAVAGATGRPTCFFRPPGGHLPQPVRVVAPQLRQRITLWSVDPQDWAIQGSQDPGPAGRAREANQIYRAAIAGTAQYHPVLLLHDSGGYRGATIAALPQIIAYYKAHGYRFVRLDGRS